MGAFNHVRPLASRDALMAGLTTTTRRRRRRRMMMMMMMMMVTSVRGDADVTPNPGILEVDLVFPRNATYTPEALMPIVLAVQNPTLSSSLELEIYWALWEGSNYTSPSLVVDGLLELPQLGVTTSDPLLVARIVNTLAYLDGVWTLAQSVGVNNCSQVPLFANSDYTTVTSKNSTVFTTSKISGQAADLVAATAPDTCGSIEGFAFNATSFSNLCGVLTPETAANPCAAQINSSAASSIYAAATAAACVPKAWQRNPNVTCPSSTGKPSSASRIAVSSTLIFLTVLLPAALTVLINLG